MKDEFEFLERLFFETYEHYLYEGKEESKIRSIDKDISEKLKIEFDTIKRSYFEIAGQGVSNDVIQSMFIFRTRRLLNFKVKIEEELKLAINDLILPDESNSLVLYNNLWFAYKCVVKLISFIKERLYVSLDDIINKDNLALKYDWIDDSKVLEWQEEFKKNYSLGDENVLVDDISVDTRSYTRKLLLSDAELELRSRFFGSKDGNTKNESNYFVSFIRGALRLINLIPKPSKDKEVFYKELTDSLKGIMKKQDKFEREQGALNLLIESNVLPNETIEYVTEDLTDKLYGKNEREIKEILIEFKNRLNKLKYRPSFSNCNLSKIERLEYTTVDRLLQFVKSKLDSIDESLANESLSLNSFDKIQTNLSVTQICLLFRLLRDDKKIKFAQETDLYKQITSAFSSKQQTNISIDSVKNNFVTPNRSAINFWKIELGVLKQLLENY